MRAMGNKADNAFDFLDAVSPALKRYSLELVTQALTERSGLSKRDRSMITVSVLIARNQSAELPFYFGQALDSAVAPEELSEIITQLAFYSGWANALAAARVCKDVFEARAIVLPPVQLLPEHLKADEQAEARRAAGVAAKFGATAPGLIQITTDVLFRDLWLRPVLSARDRCVVTLCAVIATSQFPQLAFYLNRAMDNGLTACESSEMMTQLAFYTGWPVVYSALPILSEVLESRLA